MIKGEDVCRQQKRKWSALTTSDAAHEGEPATAPTCLLLDLPNEVLFVLFQYIESVVDLCRLGATCKSLYAHIADPLVWQRLYRALPGTLANATPIRWGHDYRWLYRARTSSPASLMASASLSHKRARLAADEASPPQQHQQQQQDDMDFTTICERALQDAQRLRSACTLTTYYSRGQLQYHGEVERMVPDGYGIMAVTRDGAIDRARTFAVGACAARLTIMKTGRVSQLDGPLTDHLKAGDWFEGAWFEGTLRKGRASFQCGPEIRYTGQIYNGMFAGDGTLSLIATGKPVYRGEWLENDAHGWGTLHSEEYVYTGTMRFGKRHGWGTMRLCNGNVYEGNFDCDKRDGWGTMRNASGSVYRGHFSDGMCDGKGVFIDALGEVTRGTWKEGKLCGYAVIDMSPHQDIDGLFGEGGWPRVDAQPGPCFEGHYENGDRHGFGTHVGETGWRFEGHYKGGKRHGLGTLVRQDGTLQRGEWAGGELARVCFDGRSGATDDDLHESSGP